MKIVWPLVCMNACMSLPCKALRNGNPADILFMCRCLLLKSLYEHNLAKVTAIYTAFFLTLRVYLCFFTFITKVMQTTSWTCNEMIQIFLVKNTVASESALQVNDATNQKTPLLMNKSVHTTKTFSSVICIYTESI